MLPRRFRGLRRLVGRRPVPRPLEGAPVGADASDSGGGGGRAAAASGRSTAALAAAAAPAGGGVALLVVLDDVVERHVDGLRHGFARAGAGGSGARVGRGELGDGESN